MVLAPALSLRQKRQGMKFGRADGRKPIRGICKFRVLTPTFGGRLRPQVCRPRDPLLLRLGQRGFAILPNSAVSLPVIGYRSLFAQR